MIALSSFKPLAKSAAVAANQRQAHATWERVFDRIVYFCPQPEPQLASPKTVFLPSEEFPRINQLVQYAAAQPKWCCLINADIQVACRLRFVLEALENLSAYGAMSLRYTLPEKKVTDKGLDFFAGAPRFWQAIAPKVPNWFRLGHILWDTWMLGALTGARTLGVTGNCYDVTPCRAIFHPTHEDREMPYAGTIQPPGNGFGWKVMWPRKKLVI